MDEGRRDEEGRMEGEDGKRQQDERQRVKDEATFQERLQEGRYLR